MREMAVRGGADPSRVVVIPHGIELSEIGLNESSSNWCSPKHEERLELLYIGRLSIEKGIDILLESCAYLVKLGEEFHLRIVGSGPKELAYRNLCHDLNLENKVTFLGTRPRNELGSIYRSAHLLCVPSISEPFSIVTIEALVSGVPVIGTNVGGIPFIVEDGVTGLIVEPKAREFATAIVYAGRNPTLLSQFAERSKTVWRERFQWKSVGDSLKRSVCSVINDSRIS
jgi:glycosyltransferase involved in cell wall biosynthesis